MPIPRRSGCGWCFGQAGQWQLRGIAGRQVKDGEVVVEVAVPANGSREMGWEIRPAGSV